MRRNGGAYTHLRARPLWGREEVPFPWGGPADNIRRLAAKEAWQSLVELLGTGARLENDGTHALLADRLALAQSTLEEGADDLPTRRDEIRDILTAAKVRILAYKDPEEPRPPVVEFAQAIGQELRRRMGCRVVPGDVRHLLSPGYEQG